MDTTIFAGEEYEDEEKEFTGAPDTTRVEVRNFSPTDVEKLKADPDLNYTQPPTVAESLWDRFKRFLMWLFSTLFEKATTTDVGRLIIYLSAIILSIVVIMMLLKVNAFKIFYSGADSGKQNYQVFHENIHEMDFDSLIKEASEKKEYRLATRLVFLHALKILSDKQLIDFRPGKTNHDYVEELSVGEIKTGLNELSFYFDYAWYGNFTVNETQFQKVKGTFRFWKEKI
ncbi:MAG: DUF4129 domain-containing protein [Cyclobacteriaceae bacterium]|nr:DUF4129 domain-containing protein [Cyclobacteriaceae bacterium]